MCHFIPVYGYLKIKILQVKLLTTGNIDFKFKHILTKSSSKNIAPIYSPTNKVWRPILFELGSQIGGELTVLICVSCYELSWVSFISWKLIGFPFLNSLWSSPICLIIRFFFSLLLCSRSCKYLFPISLFMFFMLGFFREVMQKFVTKKSTFFLPVGHLVPKYF